MPRVLELFEGTGSIGNAFERIGWDVVSVDLVAKFCPTHVADVATFDKHAVKETLKVQQHLLTKP